MKKNLTLHLIGILISTNLFSQNISKFEGRWCNNDQMEETGEYLSLSISPGEKGEFTSSFSNGGPFEETHTIKPLTEKKIWLYFESVGGSISFNELQDDVSAKCKLKQLAECELLNDYNVKITIYPNDCTYLPSGKSFILRKLSEGETCGDY